MELHTKEHPLADGQLVIYVFDESGTLQGHVQGQGSKWKAYIGRTSPVLLDTFDEKDVALDILSQEIIAAEG